ncbi:MAG: TerB family tellurite resistance protein [Bdellovibrionales bacterium]|nr:TerB family tellurite resistance protein [Bdellovibrionales bacterium]
MFKKVMDFLKGEATLEVDSSGDATSEDMQIATGVLLLEMAGSDKDYDPEEVHTVFRTMEREFKVDQDEALRLLESADKLRGAKGKIDEFIKTLNENFSEEQRVIVLSMVWQVVMADGKVDKFEKRFAQQIQNRLKLSDEQAEEARQMAAERPID